jgi:hypothetical protein
LGMLKFDSAQSYTLAGTGSLTLQSTVAGGAIVDVRAGSHEIAVPVVLGGDTVIEGPGSLEFSSGISGNHTLTVLGNITASSIQVDTLAIGNAGAAAVPEPSASVLLGLGVLGLFFGFRRRCR